MCDHVMYVLWNVRYLTSYAVLRTTSTYLRYAYGEVRSESRGCAFLSEEGGSLAVWSAYLSLLAHHRLIIIPPSLPIVSRHVKGAKNGSGSGGG